MEITPKELTERGYVLLEQLEHKELVQFLRTYMKKNTKYAAFYYLTNIIFFGLVGYFFVQGYNIPNYRFGNRFTHFCFGIAISFTALARILRVSISTSLWLVKILNALTKTKAFF